MPSKAFHDLLTKCREVHDRKSADYAQEGNSFSNFQRAAQIASWFNDNHDKTFTVLIGVKLARLAELLNGKEPKNESVQDSFEDLVNYCALWAAFHIEKGSLIESRKVLAEKVVEGLVSAPDHKYKSHRMESQ